MPGFSPFNLQINDLRNLGQDRAVESMRRLIWAEAARVGIGKNLIDVPGCINHGDGGIDAYIENATPRQDDVIPAGTSGFQIKSSDLQPDACKKELHVGNDLNQPLKPEIKKVLDAGGTYVLVLFADITSAKARVREQAVMDELTRLDCQNPKIRLYTANKLAGFIERFPALVAWFKNDRNYCLPYLVWSENREIQEPKSFVFDEVRRRAADEITDKLRNPNAQCVVFRITGLSGIGKTRFVFETLRPDDISQRVIYVEADSFGSSPLYQTLQTDQNISAIIVVDECNLQQHERFVRSFSARGDRLALITLSYEIGQVPPPSLLYGITKLSQESMKELIKADETGLPSNVVERLSQFADGYPRIASLLVKSYRAIGGETQAEFINISDDGLMDRLIGGRDTISDHSRKTKKLLQWLSLFSKIGLEGELVKESKWVSKTVGIDFSDFQDIVAEQRTRGIIQGQNYIYVTPFMLRIYLLRGWWESHGFTNESFKQFVESIPEIFRTDLLRRFFDQLPYISTSEKGKEFAQAILGREGLFSDGSFIKTKLGGSFFLSLVEADPESALQCFQFTIGSWSKDELLAFKEGRREAVWALEKIAVWGELFAEAARLLLNLAEAENESYGNNASGVFVDLFSPGPGGVAPTEAAPVERFPLLQEAVNSESKVRRSLGFKACSKALESTRFSRLIGPEYQGLKREAQLWRPKNRQEVVGNYLHVWRLLFDKLEDFDGDGRQEAVKILLGHIRGLSYVPELVDTIVSDITWLATKPYENKKQILSVIESILHYGEKDLPASTTQKWEKLRDNLVGVDFHSLLERYVGMDLLEDRFDDDGKRIDKAETGIKKLVEQIIKNPKLIEPELNWLPTNEAENGYRFAYELGLADEKLTLLQILINAQGRASDKENSSDYFLGGYLKALFERDPEGWEGLLDRLAGDEKLANWVPGLTWRSGLSDRAATRILDLAKKGVITPAHFRVFGLGSVIKDLSEGVFIKWVDFLLSNSEDYAVSIALDLYQFFYLRKESKCKLPDKLSWQLLTHPSLFKKFSKYKRDQMDGFHWKEIGNKFVGLYPENCLSLAETVFEHLGEEGGILEDYHSDTQEVIDNIARRYPEEVWSIIVKYLGPPIDSRAFHIKEWLRGSEFSPAGESGALSFFPIKKVWKWIDGNVEKRAWYVASFAPKSLFRQPDKVCWAREILARYGDRKEVRREMGSNFYTEAFSGPASLHYQQKKEQLLTFKEGESDSNVKRWIDEVVSSLDKQISHESVQEERGWI